ncbi:MAG: tRNA dihydrouridine synthase DusB [Clostridia bacterium]|nr:tRNA dihydrouridine synthase DusB [Clostridia bacterium]
MKIGSVEIKNNVFLAPMAGVTDMPFRKLCREFGAGLVYTEMASSKAVEYKSEKTENIYRVFEEEHPIAIQIFGSEPEIMANTAEKLSNFADLIDINMGCPANKIVKNGEGSALMKNLDLAARIIEATVKASKVPVSVKMRKGWDEKHINAPELAKVAENCGAVMVTIHGRTREQMYSGEADLEIIRKVKETVKIPVIGNGDIRDFASAERMFKETRCDGIMVARGAQGNPWIFREILTGKSDKPTVQEKIALIIRHLELEVAHKGEYTGIREMRKHIANYLKGVPNSSQIKEEINHLESAEEVKAVLNNIRKMGEKIC